MSKAIQPFGRCLEAARDKSGLSKRKFAKIAGCELRGLQKILQGSREPGVLLAVRLVAATGVDVGDFFEQLHIVMQEHAENLSDTASAPACVDCPHNPANNAGDKIAASGGAGVGCRLPVLSGP